MSSLACRRATSQDFQGILDLQSANYVRNLAMADRKEGFLSAEFTREQLSEMTGDLGIMVAVDSGSVAGYLCAFRNEFNHDSPFLAKMLASYDRMQFLGEPLSS